MVHPHDVPKNVYMMPWIPQNALLALPNTKLFISHSGLNGAMAAAYFGVPLVAIPIADDQYNHANKLVNHLKMGEQLNLKSLTTDSLYKAIETVMNDTENAQKVSEVFMDQTVGKREVICCWVDWVLRHNGVPHLWSVAHQLTWYQYESLDCLTFLVRFIILMLWCRVVLSRHVITSLLVYVCHHVNQVLDKLFELDPQCEDNVKKIQ